MSDDNDKKAASGAPVTDPDEGPGKGKAFFDRAKAVGTTGNYDYAIDMYIEGLKREPFNIAEHDALRKIALERKMKGGKPAGGLLGPKLPFKGKTPKEIFLNNEFLVAKDPGNPSFLLIMVRNALAMQLKELVLWSGTVLMQANKLSKTPKKDLFIELANIYEQIKEYSKASEALQGAVKLDPTNMDLIGRAKDLSAQETLAKGKYESGESFKGSIKDQEMTKQLLQEENLSRSTEYRTKALESARIEYEKDPTELQVITKYAKALEQMEDEDHENQAMALLKQAYEKTQIYRLKAFIGDIRMRQYKRTLRMLREAVKADPKDTTSIAQFKQTNKERLAYELAEYLERAEHMPTDLLVKYELGVRQWESGHFDEAIVAFQEAQQNPKHRVDALHFLGRSFLTQGMRHEAVETLRKSIDEYELAPTGDKKSKELHYWYARALEDDLQTPQAIEVYSKIIRWDIGYLDARKRLNELREKLGGEKPQSA
jgi:tetratricopeptide (TPR) repeat protein